MNDERDADVPEDSSAIVLDASGGVPAVAVGTSQEHAAERPSAVRDSASADVPAVAAGTDEETPAHKP